MLNNHWTRGKAVRAVSTAIAFVALMSSILTIGLQSVAGADSVTGTIATGTGTSPIDVAVNPAGTFAYVANFGTSTVSKIDLSTNTVVATIPLPAGSYPSRIAIDSSGTYAYVSDFGNNNGGCACNDAVSRIDLSTNAVTTISLPSGSNPEQIAVTGSSLYVADRGSNSISVITVSTFALAAPLATTSTPEGIVVNGTDAYVTNRTAGTVSEIALSGGSLVGSPITVGSLPSRIAMNSAGTFVYVTNSGTTTVSVIQLSTNTVVATITVGAVPDAVALDSAYAYVSNDGTTTVSVIQLSTNTVVATITVGTSPEGIAVNPADTYAYVANIGSNNVSVIQLSSTVTFSANGGTGTMAPETGKVTAPLTTDTFARSNYTFAGWSTNVGGGGTTYTDGQNYPFNPNVPNVTLYAQWTGTNYTVTFSANGGTGTMTPETGNVTAPLTTNSFTRSTYSFISWNTVANGSGTTYAAGALYPFNSSTTLYAQWGLTGVTDDYSYVAGATGTTGTAPTASSGPDGTTITLPANPFTFSGYTFAGWSDGTATHAAGYVYILASTPIVFTAQWTPISVGCGSCGVAPTLNSLTISASSVNVMVGGTISPTASVTSGLATGDTATVGSVTLTYAGTGSTVYAASTTAPSAAGTYSVTPSAATVTISPSTDAANYSTTYTYVGGAVVISPSVVTPPPPSPVVVPHASRLVGIVVVGTSRHVTIIGTGFAKGSHVRSTEKGAVVRVISVSANRIVLLVTVRKGQRPSRNVFIITAASTTKACRIAYITR